MAVSAVGIHLFEGALGWGQFGGFAYFKIVLRMEQYLYHHFIKCDHLQLHVDI
jgi:hypothetical protein